MKKKKKHFKVPQSVFLRLYINLLSRVRDYVTPFKLGQEMCNAQEGESAQEAKLRK